MKRVLLFAALAVVAVLARDTPAGHASPADDPLARFLPSKPDHKLCFSASFDDVAVNLSARHDDAGSERSLTGLTAQLYRDDAGPIPYDKGQFGYDWRYQVLVEVNVAGERTLFGGVECPFRARDVVDPETKRVRPRTAQALRCFQDCEGGGLMARPAPDGTSLLIELDNGQPSRWLRVGGSCGEGTFRLGPRPNSRTLRLSRAPASACGAIDGHYR